MLFETSKARITVPSRCGSAKLIVGRASPTQTRTSATANSANGTCRRHRRPRRDAVVGTSPSAARRSARRDRRRDEPHVREHEERDEREAEQHPGGAERHQARRRFRDSTMRTMAVTRSSAGRDLADVARRHGAVAACSSASRCSPASRKPVPELVVARVDDELLTGLGVLDDDQPCVGKLVLARVEEPDRDDLVPLAQSQQRLLPARAR